MGKGTLSLYFLSSMDLRLLNFLRVSKVLKNIPKIFFLKSVIRPGSVAILDLSIFGPKFFFLTMIILLFKPRQRSENIPRGYKLTRFGPSTFTQLNRTLSPRPRKSKLISRAIFCYLIFNLVDTLDGLGPLG